MKNFLSHFLMLVIGFIIGLDGIVTIEIPSQSVENNPSIIKEEFIENSPMNKEDKEFTDNFLIPKGKPWTGKFICGVDFPSGHYKVTNNDYLTTLVRIYEDENALFSKEGFCLGDEEEGYFRISEGEIIELENCLLEKIEG